MGGRAAAGAEGDGRADASAISAATAPTIIPSSGSRAARARRCSPTRRRRFRKSPPTRSPGRSARLREVVSGPRLDAQAATSQSAARGRDTPGSNWHFYPFDPEGHTNELYYGIEQVGWDGCSQAAGAAQDHAITSRPTCRTARNMPRSTTALADGVDPRSGWRAKEWLRGEIRCRRRAAGPAVQGRAHRAGAALRQGHRSEVPRFYRDTLGLTVTEEVTWHGHRCVFLRCNTEHHTMALYPIALRAELGLRPHSTLDVVRHAGRRLSAAARRRGLPQGRRRDGEASAARAVPRHRLQRLRARSRRPRDAALLLHGADRLGRQAAAGRACAPRSTTTTGPTRCRRSPTRSSARRSSGRWAKRASISSSPPGSTRGSARMPGSSPGMTKQQWPWRESGDGRIGRGANGIGQAVQRKEDLRFAHRPGQLWRRPQAGEPGPCGDGALAPRACAHQRHRHARGAGGAGRGRGPDRRRLHRRRAEAHSAQSRRRRPARRGGAACTRRRRSPRADYPMPADKARFVGETGGDGRRRDDRAGEGRGRARRGRLGAAAGGDARQRRDEAGRAAALGRGARQSLRRCRGRRRGGDRRGLHARRARRAARHLDPARHRRADGDRAPRSAPTMRRAGSTRSTPAPAAASPSERLELAAHPRRAAREGALRRARTWAAISARAISSFPNTRCSPWAARASAGR